MAVSLIYSVFRYAISFARVVEDTPFSALNQAQCRYPTYEIRVQVVLTLPIEARAHQNDTENQSTAAKERRDDVRGAFGGLKLQVADPGHVLGLLGCKYGDGESDQPKKHQYRSANYQPIHRGTTHANLQCAM